MKLTQRPFFIPAVALCAAITVLLGGVIIASLSAKPAPTLAAIGPGTPDEEASGLADTAITLPNAPDIAPIDSVADINDEADASGDAGKPVVCRCRMPTRRQSVLPVFTSPHP